MSGASIQVLKQLSAKEARRNRENMGGLSEFILIPLLVPPILKKGGVNMNYGSDTNTQIIGRN